MLPASGRREARTASVPDEILVVSERGMDLLAIETAVRQRLRGLRMRTARDMNAAREIARAAPAVRFVLIADHLLRRIAPVRLASLRARFAGAEVAALGTVTEAEARQWLEEGLAGILSPQLDPERFAAALQFMIAGNRYVDPDILARAQDRSGICLFNGQNGLMDLLNRLPVPILLLFDRRVVYANEAASTVMLDGDKGQSDLPLTGFVVPEQQQAVEALLAADPPSEPLPLAFLQSGGPPRRMLTYWGRHTLFGAGGLSCVGVMMEPGRAGGDQTEPGSNAVGVPSADPPPALIALTFRQRQVLDCLAEGCSNKEIAARLNISAATVKLHVHNILRSLGLPNRTSAAIAARGFLR